MLPGIDPKALEWQQTQDSRSALHQLPDYVYQPLLQGQDTRVLRLQPLRDVQDDIVCRIEHISIGEGSIFATRDYEALSYVCGPDQPSCLIKHVDGALSSKLSIRPYLFDAIKGLGPSTIERILWIDQISVDQNNLSERADQVRKFSAIFTRASKVIIWIREPEWSTVGTAFWFAESLSKQMIEAKLHLIKATPDIFLDNLIDLPANNDPKWVALRNFLKNQWFFRAWTFQECILARKAQFVCGPHSLRMTTFLLIAGVFNTFQETERSENSRFRDGSALLRRIVHVQVAVSWSRESKTSAESQIAGSLYYLLSTLRSLKCYDVRDKVWAIIGIVNDYDEDALPVDYQSSWQSIYTRVCHWIHRRYQDLSFLPLVEIRKRDMKGDVDKNRPGGLPSWVPLFQSEPDYLNQLYQPLVKQRHDPASKIYYASGSSQSTPQAGLPNEEGVLICTGLKIGVITNLTSPAGNLMGSGTGIGARVLEGGEWQALVRSTFEASNCYPPTGENIDIAFERLRIGDQLPNEYRRSRKEVPTALPQPGKWALAERSSSSGEFFIAGELKDIGSAIIRATTRRRMFITDTGYMGLTHRSNLVGDEIWVLMGADMPVTLHPKSVPNSASQMKYVDINRMKEFEFRGESYVHGIMDGEALISARKQEDVNCPLGNEWLDDLGAGPSPFTTEEIALV